MGIGSVSDYSGMFANYRVPQIPSADFDEIKKADKIGSLKQNEPARDVSAAPVGLEIEEIQQKRQNADVREISLTFNADEDFSYLGKDSDIENLDMQKAISDMKKDQVLQQYQYFVGASDGMALKNAGEDGLVFVKF